MSDAMTRPIRFGSNSGQPVTRRDGVAKVTGAATFAADNAPEGLLHAVFVPATIARGRVTGLDVAAAEAHPGVTQVMTPANRPPLEGDPSAKPTMFSFRVDVLQDDTVRYAGQPIALVVAETLEAATEGARLLNPRYDAEPARTRIDDGAPFAFEPAGFGLPADVEHGDVAAGHAAAARSIDVTYETPSQYHNAMETHAVVAAWEGDRLTLDMPSQALAISCAGYAFFFGIPAENVTLRSPYLGGGFGSKAIPTGPQVLAILAARTAGRPVKLVVTRQQMFGPVGHRGATRQRLRLGVDAAAALTVIDHENLAATSTFDDFVEPAAGASQGLYAAGALRSSPPGRAPRHRHARADAGAGRGFRVGRARMRDGRDGGGRRHRSARIPAAQLRRDGAGNRPPLFLQGAAGMLRAGCGTLRLGGPAARAAADARRERPAGRLGHGHGALSLPDVRGGRAGDAQGGRHGAGGDVGR